MHDPKQPFLETLYQLRTIERVILYNKIESVSVDEERDVADFLQSEYEREATDYPFEAPSFHQDAAIWGAKTLYFASQLLLYREDKPAELREIVPGFSGTINAGALLSADLCLRFLPQVILQLIVIDAEDPLAGILNEYLKKFHYSAVGYDIDLDNTNWDMLENECLNQLYLDRVTERKAAKWASIPAIRAGLFANMGQYKNDFWRNIDLTIIN